MASELHELRIEKAKERGFIPEGTEDKILIERGLEDMHDAPLAAIGRYALTEDTNQESTSRLPIAL